MQILPTKANWFTFEAVCNCFKVEWVPLQSSRVANANIEPKKSVVPRNKSTWRSISPAKWNFVQHIQICWRIGHMKTWEQNTHIWSRTYSTYLGRLFTSNKIYRNDIVIMTKNTVDLKKNDILFYFKTLNDFNQKTAFLRKIATNTDILTNIFVDYVKLACLTHPKESREIQQTQTN